MSSKAFWSGTVLVAISALIVMIVIAPFTATALQPQARSLFVNTTAAGAATDHIFSFTYPTATTVGSIRFEYCTSPLIEIACTEPSGVDVSGVVLTDQTGETDFSVLATSTNTILLSRAPVAANTVPASYTFNNAVNPSSIGTFYVRIFIYPSIDGTGSYSDFGAVVNAITRGVAISTEVPPILNFCVGLTIASDCSSAEGNLIGLGNLTPDATARGTSQMLAATNADFGLAIAVHGRTMTSGNDEIPALTTPTSSLPGASQFGLNLRQNTVPSIGQEPSGSGLTNPTSDYNIPDFFQFQSGDTVATSPDATDTRTFTASYIVNVSEGQAPGVYTATLTYICTATF